MRCGLRLSVGAETGLSPDGGVERAAQDEACLRPPMRARFACCAMLVRCSVRIPLSSEAATASTTRLQELSLPSRRAHCAGSAVISGGTVGCCHCHNDTAQHKAQVQQLACSRDLGELTRLQIDAALLG